MHIPTAPRIGLITASLGIMTALIVALSGCTGTPNALSGQHTGQAANASPSAFSQQPPHGVPRCGTSSLRGAVDNRLSGQQTLEPYLVVTNTGHATCTLSGFPAVTWVAGPQRVRVGAGAEYSPNNPHPAVNLKPGAHGYFWMTINLPSKYTVQRCRPAQADGFQLYPPRSPTPLFIAFPIVTCANNNLPTMTVDAIQGKELHG